MEKEIVGGVIDYLKDNTYPTYKLLGGYQTQHKVSNNVLPTLKAHLFDWKALQNSSITDKPKKKLELLNSILCINPPVLDEKVLCSLVKNIASLTDAELKIAISKSLNIKEPLEIALYNLFNTWKDLINRFREKHAMQTVESEKTYKGYCRFEPVTRILLLMNFNMNLNIDPEIGKKIKNCVDNAKKMMESKIPIEIDRSNLNFDTIDKCIDSFLELCNRAKTSMQSAGDKFILIADQISSICKEIEKINIV